MGVHGVSGELQLSAQRDLCKQPQHSDGFTYRPETATLHCWGGPSHPASLSLLTAPSLLCIPRAVIVAQLCTASTFFTLLSWLPTFFKETFPESKVSTVLGGRGGLGCLCCFQSLGWLSNERCRAGDTVLLQ